MTNIFDVRSFNVDEQNAIKICMDNDNDLFIVGNKSINGSMSVSQWFLIFFNINLDFNNDVDNQNTTPNPLPSFMCNVILLYRNIYCVTIG